jgi:hypothetical protein
LRLCFLIHFQLCFRLSCCLSALNLDKQILEIIRLFYKTWNLQVPLGVFIYYLATNIFVALHSRNHVIIKQFTVSPWGFELSSSVEQDGVKAGLFHGNQKPLKYTDKTMYGFHKILCFPFLQQYYHNNWFKQGQLMTPSHLDFIHHQPYRNEMCITSNRLSIRNSYNLSNCVS